MVKKYHAVTRGKRPGLYNSFEEAQQQVIGFPRSKLKTFPNLKVSV